MKEIVKKFNSFVCEEGMEFTEQEFKNALIVCVTLAQLLCAACIIF